MSVHVRRAVLITIATVVLMAPLVCMRFCQLMADMPGTAATSMDGMDAHGTHGTHGAHDAASNTHHAPLNHMRELVNAVTDYVTTQPAFAVLLVVVALVAMAYAQRVRISFDVPHPPPRLLAI